VATRTDGTLWAWGANNDSQLGDGGTTSINAPERIGSANNWKSVSAGYLNTLATRNDATLWGWGANGDGQLGDGTFTSIQITPEQIGPVHNWTAISSGGAHTLAVRGDGTV